MSLDGRGTRRRRARRAGAEEALRLKARGNHAGLVHVGPLHLLFLVGILEVRLSNALADGGIPRRAVLRRSRRRKAGDGEHNGQRKKIGVHVFHGSSPRCIPSGMRHPALSKGCRAPCKYATPTHRLAARSKRRAAEARDETRVDRSNCIRSPPAGQDLQDINLPPTRANGVVASQSPRAWFSGNAMHLARRRLFYLAACAAALPASARNPTQPGPYV